jgi:single-strand DNA-binding protein
MLNHTILTGRLVRDPELRYTSSGVPVTNFTLAVNKNYKNDSGETEADFINCVAWRQVGETIGHLTHKGALIGVRGRLQSRSFESDGKTVYVTEVNVEEFAFLEKKKEEPAVAPEQFKPAYQSKYQKK